MHNLDVAAATYPLLPRLFLFMVLFPFLSLLFRLARDSFFLLLTLDSCWFLRHQLISVLFLILPSIFSLFSFMFLSLSPTTQPGQFHTLPPFLLPSALPSWWHEAPTSTTINNAAAATGDSQLWRHPSILRDVTSTRTDSKASSEILKLHDVRRAI